MSYCFTRISNFDACSGGDKSVYAGHWLASKISERRSYVASKAWKPSKLRAYKMNTGYNQMAIEIAFAAHHAATSMSVTGS